MKVKGIVAEDFSNYKEPSLFIISAICDWKCCQEAGTDVCQNSELAKTPVQDLPNETIYKLFTSNPITKAVVIGGLEPMLQLEEVYDLIDLFRKNGDNSPFIIYTGYYPNEIPEALNRLKNLFNINIKFGRFVPDRPHRYDEVLGITLSSDNQYGEVLC